MLVRTERIIFFLLVFFISSQVGLHFWPEFAYVHGIRIDYLSPTLYLLDILIFSWIAVWVVRDVGVFRAKTNKRTLQTFIILIFLSLGWNIFNAASPGAHIFGVVKLVEFGLFGLLVAKTFTRNRIGTFVEVLSISAIVSSVLAIWQFINQSSIGGLWYYFGERSFSSSTIGISTVNLDSQILRSYGAFPHPNVLAFFLFTAIVFAALRLIYEKNAKVKIFLSFTIFISTVALLTTFSRVSIFLLITFSFYVIYSNIKSNVFRFGLAVSFFVLLLVGLSSNDWMLGFLSRGIDFRTELLEQSLIIFTNSHYFGIGLNNFFIHQAPLVKSVTPILFQPPHNIYVLALLSLGVFGFWIFPALMFETVRSLVRKLQTTSHQLKAFYKGVFIVFSGILFVGLFDHFFLTLEQGQIIFALILGLAFAKLDPDRFEKRKSKR